MSNQRKNLAALLTAVATPLIVEVRATPKPGPDEVLIRNHAIAINPLEWKRQAWGFGIPSYPTVIGSGELTSPTRQQYIY